MLNQELIYSEKRGTWNLFVNNEWYLEGTYEQCEEAMWNNAVCDAEEECGYYEDDYEDEYCEEEDLALIAAYAEVTEDFGII